MKVEFIKDVDSIKKGHVVEISDFRGHELVRMGLAKIYEPKKVTKPRKPKYIKK